jgi:putative copper resistance protein D
VNGPLVIARAVHFAATLLLTGTVAFECFVSAPVLAGKTRAALACGLPVRLAWISWAALAAALLSGAAWLVLLSGEIGDMPAAQALSQGLPWTVLTQTTFGVVWTLRLVIAAVLAAVLLARGLSHPVAAAERAGAGEAGFVVNLACAVLAAAFAAGLAWSGHAAGMEGTDGTIHLCSDMVHVVAAGAWLGALWPLSLLLAAARRAGDPMSVAIADQATRRFSVLGMISVAAILATGVVNTFEILGAAAFTIAAAYNRLLLAKIVLFFAMVAIAAFNRQRLTPRLSGVNDHRRAMARLQWNSLAEAALGLIILAIVAVLGRMTPHMHG